MSSSSYSLGQRWLSNTETELGLGTLVAIEGRRLTLLYTATGEERVYAMQNAPLTRITFAEEETITSQDGWQMVVANVTEQEGILIYSGVRQDTQDHVDLVETQISHDYKLNQPEKRLFTQQFDHPKWFDLRKECLQFQHDHFTSPLLGFLGARVDLIPHQLHIASEVGRRYAPRVLLADEVGLGKTIEAALIIHQQILTGRAKRILIVVPSSLVHQWLVEMLRRVNLSFSIFDEERCQSMEGEAGNPFESEQLVLCSLDFLTHNTQYYQQALAASWDLMAVDEAHHLTWSPGQVSPQYQVVEGLAEKTPGVLLLTATPDQLGHESHFARLRLLDSARFHDYQEFVEEQHHFSQLADAITPLLSGEKLDSGHTSALNQFIPVRDFDLESTAQRSQLVNRLLDQHGTGRLLFRNSRAGIEGFPVRHLHTYKMVTPPEYVPLMEQGLPLCLRPEQAPEVVESWTEIDPRVNWFIEQLSQLKDKKVLTICAKAATALQLNEALRVKAGIKGSVFHEGMSIVERDRAANYFAQSEEGAQVLICSEIGSEGRNFQFAHHLVLFDLPLVPDLLEQRIGRLDRIGQKQDIQLHVPYFADSAQQVLLNWYHIGLQAFTHTCPVGTSVYEQTQEQLEYALLNPLDEPHVSQLLDTTSTLSIDLRSKLEEGRDRLLELNSSGKGKVDAVIQPIQDSDDSPRLERFMNRLFDALGVAQEEHDEACYLLKATESMVTALPGLNEEGMTVTYERATATTLEHVHFFSWDHPMINHAMEMLTTDVLGKSCVALQNNPSLPVGSFFIECLFIVRGKAHPQLQLSRFMPATPFVLCNDHKGLKQPINGLALLPVKKKIANQLITALQQPLEQAIDIAKGLAFEQAEKYRQQAQENMQDLLGEELTRLQTLKEINPSIRQEEIDFVQRQMLELTQAIKNSDVELEAIRFVVNTH